MNNPQTGHPEENLPPHGRQPFASADQRDDAFAQARARQRSRIAVAPNAWLEIRPGERLQAGDTVPESALDAVMRERLRDRQIIIILERHELELRAIPQDATHVVVSAVTSARGVLSPGQLIAA